MSGLMDKKCGLVMGVANDKSIAWGIAKQLLIKEENLLSLTKVKL